MIRATPTNTSDQLESSLKTVVVLQVLDVQLEQLFVLLGGGIVVF